MGLTFSISNNFTLQISCVGFSDKATGVFYGFATETEIRVAKRVESDNSLFVGGMKGEVPNTFLMDLMFRIRNTKYARKYKSRPISFRYGLISFSNARSLSRK